MNSPRHNALLRQITRLEHRLTGLERTSRQLSTVRLIAALVLVVSALIALTVEGAFACGIVALMALVVFILLVAQHNRLKRDIYAFRTWQYIKRRHVARLTLDWATMPPASVAEPQPDHPFEVDLDVTGEYSLHRLLDTTATREGSDRLREWLLTTMPDIGAIRQRQTLVAALKDMPNFRDKLALYGTGRKARSAQALAWLKRPKNTDRRVVVGLSVFALVNFGLLLGDALGVVPPLWRATMPAYFITFLVTARGIGDIFGDSLDVRESVETFNGVFRHLESAHYGDRPALKALAAPFLDPAQKPTRQLASVRWLLIAASLRSNIVLWFPLNLFLPWDTLVAWGLDRVRNRLAVLLPRWLDVWYELEALSALATYAYLHPNTVFPQMDEVAEAAFEGQGLGHPLIREDVKVRNDFTLEGVGKLVIITGSNMSGKSSFLRTVGLALCMAYAGGTVDARGMRVSTLRLFTCIRVSDSVVEGFSYFYAEVRRLKALLDALDAPSGVPVFYLIDEIFKGTNNRERLIGSRSYLRALVGRRGLGLVSTHDLELVALADELGGVSNMHFREGVADERMVFDYRLRDGASPTTNALTIMRLAGLPIETDKSQ